MAWTEWITNNNRGGHENNPLITPLNNSKPTLLSIEVKEQAGFGIVDLRLHYSDPDSPGYENWTDWACDNPHGQLHSVYVPAGKIAVGMSVREQPGYGVVDLNLHLLFIDYSRPNW